MMNISYFHTELQRNQVQMLSEYNGEHDKGEHYKGKYNKETVLYQAMCLSYVTIDAVSH